MLPGSTASTRLAQLQLCVPEMFAVSGELLYVGAHPNRAEMALELKVVGHHMTLLEAWPANADFYQKQEAPLFDRVLCGDVRNIAPLASYKGLQWDFSVWWHGPEHVPLEELEDTLLGLRIVTRQTVVAACPWGKNDQGAAYGNPFERHQARLMEEHFTALGYSTATDGVVNVPWSQLLAWHARRS